MSSGAINTSLGFVLHRRPYRESSVLVDLLSQDFGRIGLVARSARSERSAWRGLLEPFMPLSVSFIQTGEMGTVRDLEPAGDRAKLEGRALWCGLYVNELLLCLTERQEPMSGLYDHYQLMVAALADSAQLVASLRRFEWQLLMVLGVAPSLTHEADGVTPIDGQAHYVLEPEAGFVRVAQAGHSTVAGEAVLWFNNPSAEALTETVSRSAKGITRRLIDHQLSGRTLRTREMMRALQ